MEPTELRRSTLERKDRDELVTIATALGSKPPSRARKAEIVDLIITTATTGSEAESSSDDSSGSGAADNKVESGDDGDGTTYHAGDDEFDFGEVKDRQGQKSKSDNKGSHNKDQAKDQSGKGGEEANDGNPERGNRRRRRRGRGNDADVDAEPIPVEGYLDLRDDGYGFLRVGSTRSSMEDAYVSVKQVRQLGLRKGDHLTGTSRPANRNEKNPAMVSIDTINGSDSSAAVDRRSFDDLTALYPTERLELAGKASDAISARVIDLFAPIGKGQRALVVAPPSSGKTTLIRDLAEAIETNHPEINLIVVAIDERPEDVTEIDRSVNEAEVLSSTFDRPGEEHVAAADMTIERAKRLVEMGRDVVVLFDGLTRLVWAQNQNGSSSGKILPGGIDPAAIFVAKRLFGAARALEEGGSLTVIATAASGTFSQGDETIQDAFVGLANMELHLSADAAAQGIFPAVDLERSHTRRQDLLVDAAFVDQVTALRSAIGLSGEPDDAQSGALAALIERIRDSKSNADLLKVVS